MDLKYKDILEEPSYWKEAINGEIYNAISEYMEKKNINRTELGKELDLSKGRISQILNDGEINFSIEKLVSIALKIGKYPDFKFVDKHDYFHNHVIELNEFDYNDISINNYTYYGGIVKSEKKPSCKEPIFIKANFSYQDQENVCLT